MAHYYYYTTAEETHLVYHDYEECDEGKKIAPLDRVDADIKPLDRDHCKVCRLLSL
jgi:hypothetical protein